MAEDDLQRYAELIQSMLGPIGPERMEAKAVFDFEKLVKNQQPSGAFLGEDDKVHPEMRWFDELVILHAMANHALESSDPSVQAAVKRAAEYHLAEIQPDHATTDPWGLLAFIQYARPLADQLLHAVRLHYPQQVTGTALLLLADVLYGLRILKSGKTMSNEVDSELLEILRCPITRSRLRQEGDFLIGEVGGLAFPVREGIPVMLAEEATLPAGVANLDEFKREFGVK